MKSLFLINRDFRIEATEKGVIPVLDAGIHLRKSLCCKEIDYRDKPDNDNFRSFSATSRIEAPFMLRFYFWRFLSRITPPMMAAVPMMNGTNGFFTKPAMM